MRVPMSKAASELMKNPEQARKLAEKIREARLRSLRTVTVDGGLTLTEVGSGSVSPGKAAARTLPPPMKFEP